MNCNHCLAWNPEEEHRCDHCGRRLFDGDQGLLFEHKPGAKVIPIQSRARLPLTPVSPSGGARPAPRKDQLALELLSPAPAAPRTLKTSVQAVVFCDAPIATPLHRALAAAVDCSMILIALGLFLLTFHFGGGQLFLNQRTLPALGIAFAAVTFWYALVWVWAGRESLGMQVFQLRLINFDGFSPDRRQRALRLAGACLSLCTGGFGLLWALVDEEKLTWQDHISQTFPTMKELSGSFVRRR